MCEWECFIIILAFSEHEDKPEYSSKYTSSILNYISSPNNNPKATSSINPINNKQIRITPAHTIRILSLEHKNLYNINIILEINPIVGHIAKTKYECSSKTGPFCESINGETLQ